MTTAYILSAVRTAGGRRNGRLAGWHPVDLAAQVLDAIVDRSGIDPAQVDDVILGCVMQVGEQAVNVARNAVLASKLPESVPGTSIDRQCGSSQQALHFAAQAVMAGSMDLVIAGGVESMTRVPLGASVGLAKQAGMGGYMSPAMKQRYGDIVFSQFDGAEMLARNYGFDRAALDAWSLESHRRAAVAAKSGLFDDEILPVPVRLADGSGDGLHAVDEGIRFDATSESIGSVKLLREGGYVFDVAYTSVLKRAIKTLWLVLGLLLLAYLMLWAAGAFLVVEALLGAGLIWLGYVAHDESLGRAFYMPAHLTNTLLLLACSNEVRTWTYVHRIYLPLTLRNY